MAIPLRFNVYRLSKKYADGLEQVELCLYREYERFLVKPPIRTRRKIAFATAMGKYEAGLKTHPPTGDIYISPDLISEQSGEKVSLARVLNDQGIKPGQDVEILVEGEVFRLAN